MNSQERSTYCKTVFTIVIHVQLWINCGEFISVAFQFKVSLPIGFSFSHKVVGIDSWTYFSQVIVIVENLRNNKLASSKKSISIHVTDSDCVSFSLSDVGVSFPYIDKCAQNLVA